MKVSFRELRNKILTFDWAPKYERKRRKAFKDGSVMSLIRSNVASMQKNDTIKHALDRMLSLNTRRVFITNAGRVDGVVTCKDIVNFLGGGDKFKIVKQKHDSSLASAINEPVRSIMTARIIKVQNTATVKSAVTLMKKTGVGGIPVEKEGKLVGMVTEKKIADLISKSFTGQMVKDHMSKKITFGSAGEQVSDISKTMVRNSFRRIPILQNRKLAGIITAKDLTLKFAECFSPTFLETRVSTLMKKPITVKSTATLSDAAGIMSKNNISGMPVMSMDKVVGVITARDLIKAVSV